MHRILCLEIIHTHTPVTPRRACSTKAATPCHACYSAPSTVRAVLRCVSRRSLWASLSPQTSGVHKFSDGEATANSSLFWEVFISSLQSVRRKKSVLVTIRHDDIDLRLDKIPLSSLAQNYCRCDERSQTSRNTQERSQGWREGHCFKGLSINYVTRRRHSEANN